MRQIEIFPGILSLMLSKAARAGRTEIGGFLIGRVERNKIIVTRATFPRQRGTTTHVAINDADMAILAEELAERNTGEVIIGWHHTHPGLGVFMSGTDISTQQRYQAFFPEAIALVMDPFRFAETLDLQDLDLKIFRVAKRKAMELDYVYAHDPSEIIPDLYSIMLMLEEPAHMIFEDTWFEKMLRDVIGESITTPEFTYGLGEFLKVVVAFGTILFFMIFIAIALLGLIL
ncbi:MAG: Mov34/MPN/PAD-1 family protein [Candidatus Thorarchaeota archaeon]